MYDCTYVVYHLVIELQKYCYTSKRVEVVLIFTSFRCHKVEMQLYLLRSTSTV